MPRQKGYILVVVLVLMTALLTYSMALIKTTADAAQTERNINYKAVSSNIAEAGLEKAVWCLNQTVGTNCGGTYGGNYSGESNVAFGGGIYDTVLTTLGGNVKQIEATGYYPNKAKPLGKSVIRTRAGTNTDKASFTYALQGGAGGFKLDGHATVNNGSIYSNGNIDAEKSSTISGDVYVAGGTALAPDQQNTTYNADFIFGQTNPQIDLAQSFTPGANNFLNKIGLYIKRTSGAPSNISVDIVNDNNNSPGSTVYASANLDPALVGTNYSWIDVSFNSPPYLYGGTKYWIILDAAQNSTKYWTIGVDAFDNYAGGTMFYAQDWSSGPWTAKGYDIDFKTWNGGVATGVTNATIGGNVAAHTISGVTAGGNAMGYTINNATITGNAWAHDITNATIGGHATSTNITGSTVGKNLWCQTYNSTTVGGTKYCPFAVTIPADPGPTDLPISDAMIAGWKNDAAASGPPFSGDKIITSDTSLGPLQINGNLTINNGKKLTLTGTVYVTGTITFINNSQLVLDSSYGSNSGILLSDDVITINQGVTFSGASANSYPLLLTTKNDTINTAINILNGSDTAIFYAPYGIIEIKNTAAMKELCAWKIHANENVTINYDSGLANLNFSSGPTGGWSKLKGYWQIVE